MRPPYRGGRPAWSTALRSGRSPYRFAGSNPAPRIKPVKNVALRRYGRDFFPTSWLKSAKKH